MIIYEDDLTGEEIPGDEARHVIVALQVNGGETQAWELCLSAKSLEAMRSSMAGYLKDELVVPVKLLPPGAIASTSRGTGDTAAIREWWRSLSPGQRVDLGDLPEPPEHNKGQVPRIVSEAYYRNRESVRTELPDTATELLPENPRYPWDNGGFLVRLLPVGQQRNERGKGYEQQDS
jgi:hypothetical protein